jgi:aryl-alcohol dehydrogenase-like predicted oxidoreductase
LFARAVYEKLPGEIAMAWTLHHPAVTGAIVGGRRPEQVERNIGAAVHLDQRDIDRIEPFIQTNP